MIALPFVRFLTEIKVSGLPPRSSSTFLSFFPYSFASNLICDPVSRRSPASFATKPRSASTSRIAASRARVDDERLRQCGIICGQREEGGRRDAAPLVANPVSLPGTYRRPAITPKTGRISGLSSLPALISARQVRLGMVRVSPRRLLEQINSSRPAFNNAAD